MSGKTFRRCFGFGLVFLAGGALRAQSTTVTYAYNGLPLAILTDAANVITVANVVVPQALTITKVTARVQIQYPQSGDLNVYLFSPQGTRTILLAHDCNVANIDTTFDDSAGSGWKDFCPVEAGRGPFRSDQPLSNFNSDGSSFGTWNLAVENDVSDSRSGWITQFSLTITGTPQVAPITRSSNILNSASFTGGGTVAPGELLSILGAGLGPLPGVSAGAGALPTSLGGSSVSFNGVPAPISFASAYRIDVQAPFNLTPGANVNVQVATSSGNSAPISLSAVDAVPGLYTNGIAGSGIVTTVNQNGTMNSLQNPAPKGSFITVYASGLGAVTPSLVEGAVPPSNPLSRVSGTVNAFVGAVPAAVLYAGSAPGFPGIYQINITIPAASSSGNQPLLLSVNGKTTQAGATVQIQ